MNMLDPKTVAALAAEIAKYMTPSIPMSIALWDAEDIAAYLKQSKRVVIERTVTLPGFPQAIRLPTLTGAKGHPKWKAEEVAAWVGKYQERRVA